MFANKNSVTFFEKMSSMSSRTIMLHKIALARETFQNIKFD